MENIIALTKELRLCALSREQLNCMKHQQVRCYSKADSRIYKNSLYTEKDILYFAGAVKNHKTLFAVSSSPFNPVFAGNVEQVAGCYVQSGEWNYQNRCVLGKIFPFTVPVSLREKRTTIGCGDRLGLATPGQLAALKQYNLFPVLAQQSMRELNFTKRTYPDVVNAAAFLVFQEGYERGYGADGDHLKTREDILAALDAGMSMITLDLSDVMRPEAAGWTDAEISAAFSAFPAADQKRLLERYANRSFPLGSTTLFFPESAVMRCTVMYKAALDYSLEIDQFIKARRGDAYDLEISIDETTAPTLPLHHLYIAGELQARGVTVNSLAPRFVGEFQKGVDYQGDIKEFRSQFALHCLIAQANGGYKISVHSGSDKFAVYPVIGAHTGLRLHLKTAGTSWLEAVRCIALTNPALYREMHKKAFLHYARARQYYHITADISRIREIDAVADAELPAYLDCSEARQLLHITYGGLLAEADLREEFFRTLAGNEDCYYTLLKTHFEKHIRLLGVERYAQ